MRDIQSVDARILHIRALQVERRALLAPSQGALGRKDETRLSQLKDAIAREMKSGLAAPRVFDVWHGPRAQAILSCESRYPSQRRICATHDFNMCRRIDEAGLVKIAKQCMVCGVIHPAAQRDTINPDFLPECDEAAGIAAEESKAAHRAWMDERSHILTSIHFFSDETLTGDALGIALALGVPVRSNDCKPAELAQLRDAVMLHERALDPDATNHEISVNYERKQYRASPQWIATQARVLRAADHTCECCGRPADIARHMSYSNMGCEDDGELLALCSDCDALVNDLQANCITQASLTHYEVSLIHLDYRAFKSEVAAIWTNARCKI